MTKTQLTEALAAELGVSKKLAAELVNCFIENVIECCYFQSWFWI